MAIRKDASCMDSHTVIAEQPHNSIEAPLIVEESDLSRKANSLSEDHHAKYASDAQTITLLHWWFPELFASGLAVLAFISLVVLLKKYDQCGIEATNLPTSLNLNGLIALLSTVIRTALMVPVGSALSQTVWLSLAAEDGTQAVHLEETDAASRGAWGCLLYLFGAKRGYV